MTTKKTILLVEDDHEMRTALKECFLDEGTYNVVDIENGIEALKWLETNPKPDIIVSDYMMMGKGSDLARAAHRVDINTIIITGNHDDALRAIQAYNIVVPIVKKPFDVFKLMGMIDKYTDTKHVGVKAPLVS